ncbi:MAG: hypothetical protein MK106_14075 [Mariniblastus sp.]|nr:hypothetical protein [Mariniblastus sp.]
MNKKNHDTTPGYHKQDKHEKKGNTHVPHSSGAIHKNWKAWVAVVLMLLAMVAYVVSEDERWRGGGQGEDVPAAAE